MNISSFATCLNVKDVEASSDFLVKHFGFTVLMSADGFTSLKHMQSGVIVIYHRIGLELLPDDFKDEIARGVILTFIVTNIESEEKRIREEGVTITTPLRVEPWGEKLFLLKDPNGVLIEIAEWAQ